MIVYRCEDSLESIFTAVYRSYEERRNHAETRIVLDDDPILFGEDVQIVPEMEKVMKVMNTIRRRFGEEDYMTVCEALATEDPEKGQAVYQTIVYGLAHRCLPGHLFDNLANDDVLKAFGLARTAWREIHHLMGFMRFRELENGILFASFAPKCNILTFLMPHFADRYPSEHFALYDERRGIFGIHPAREQWYLQWGDKAPKLRYSAAEKLYSELFREFCRSIAIKARFNPKLQRQMLPLRYREYMMEFDTSQSQADL